MGTETKLLCDECFLVSGWDDDNCHDCPRCTRNDLNPVNHRVISERISVGDELDRETAQAFLSLEV